MATQIKGADNAYLAGEFGYEAGIAIQRDMSKAIAKTIATGAKDHYLRELDKMFNVKKHARNRARAHGAVAKSMQSAVSNAVSQIKSKPYTEPRKNRLSGGLARAVNNPQFAKGDEFGIKFVDRELMRQEARHWQRLNFGTGALQTPAMVAKPRLGGRQLLDVTIKPIAVTGGSKLKDPRIPDGYFMHGSEWVRRGPGYSRTGNPFYPIKTKKVDFITTAPIRPKRFIDAGLQAFETNLPAAYRDLIDQFAGQGKSTKQVVNTKA